jgi:hypothetical protein
VGNPGLLVLDPTTEGIVLSVTQAIRAALMTCLIAVAWEAF